MGTLGAVISFGLLFALILTLLVMPVIYYYFQNDESAGNKKISKTTYIEETPNITKRTSKIEKAK